jgi:CTP synthase (UTP-ammonia lyase)
VLLGDYSPRSETHIATNSALAHSAAALGLQVTGEWISSLSITPELLAQYDGLWVTPGPPHEALENSLAAIQHAREQGIPTFANCGGFQLVVLEIARNILGIRDAQRHKSNAAAGPRDTIR